MLQEATGSLMQPFLDGKAFLLFFFPVITPSASKDSMLLFELLGMCNKAREVKIELNPQSQN